MQVDDADACLVDGIQKRGRKDVHPAREHNELWSLELRCREDLLGEGGVVLSTGFCDFCLVRLAFLLEAVADEVKVLPGDACKFPA